MFPNHILKFRRARYHLQELRRHVLDWFSEPDSHSEWWEDDPNDPDYVLIKARAKQIPSEPFALIVGDVIQNLRNCLEHLAFELASAYTKPLPDQMASQSQFPVVGDVNSKGIPGQGSVMFQSQRKCIQGIDPAAQSVIEGLQPYQRGNDFFNDPLWLLKGLSNVDKHRTLHLSTLYPHAFTFNPGSHRYPLITIPGVKPLNWTYTGAGLGHESETVIARIRVQRIADPNVNMNLEIAPSVAFADGVAVHEDIIQLLQSLELHVYGKVVLPLTRFLRP